MVHALETISSSRLHNDGSNSTARCLLQALCEFEQIVALSVSHQLMLHFKNVTVAMQGVDVDIVTGFNMIKTVKETLQNVSLFG